MGLGLKLQLGGSDWSLQDYLKMQPIAYLALLSLPGENKLKNLRYFLGRGDNIVGSDPRCQIIVPSKYQLPNYIANIRIGYNFITIQALHSHLVYVEGNLAKFHRDPETDNFFMLALNTQYIPKVGEFFFIGRIKAVVGAVPHHQLVLMRNVVNQASFRRGLTEREELQRTARELNLPQANRERKVDEDVFQNVTLEQDYFPFQKKDKHQGRELFKEFASSQGRISEEKSKQNQQQLNIVAEEQKSHTEVLDQQNYQQEATLVLQQGIYAYEPTINLDQPFFPEIHFDPQPPAPPVYSQQLLLNEIRMRSQSRSQNPPEDDDFSMPDTIIDKENNEAIEEKNNQRPHIEQVQSKEEKIEEDDDDQMPPTIKEVDEISNRIKPAKTMVNPPKAEAIEERRLYKSGPLPKDSSIKSQASAQINPIQDFMDLFDLGDPVSTKKSSLKHKMSEPLADGSKDFSLMQMSSVRFTSLQEKEPQPQSHSPPRKKQESEAEPRQKLKVHFVGFKPTATHKDLLKKQHFETVTGPDEDYDILLVKQPLRISNRLLLALIDGKRIETEQWIFSKQAVIQSKLNGLTWKQIYEIKGTHKLLLKGKGKFYVSKRLEELLENIIESMGGQVVTELTDKRKVINVILRAEDSQDTQIYLQNHQNKKWRFIKCQSIIDTVLTGKFTLDKYLIKLFNQ